MRCLVAHEIFNSKCSVIFRADLVYVCTIVLIFLFANFEPLCRSRNRPPKCDMDLSLYYRDMTTAATVPNLLL